jgi:ribosomal protein L31
MEFNFKTRSTLTTKAVQKLRAKYLYKKVILFNRVCNLMKINSDRRNFKVQIKKLTKINIISKAHLYWANNLKITSIS